MKNKIAKIGFAALAAMMLCAPAIVLAQIGTDPYAGGFRPSDYDEAGTGAGMTERTLTEIIRVVMQWLLYILGFLAIIVFIVAGIMYLTSGGDETKTEKAKKWIIYAIVGVVIALSGLIIMNLIYSFLDLQ